MTRIFCRHQHALLFLGAILLSAFFCNASAQQDANPDAQFVIPKKTKHHAEKKEETQQPIKLDGVLLKAIKTQKPWEVISPLAPASEGDGEKMISIDPEEPDKPQGFILFGIQW